MNKVLIIRSFWVVIAIMLMAPVVSCGITEDFYPRDEAYWTGFVSHGSGYTKVDGSISAGFDDNPWPQEDYLVLGWATFDITGLPSNACVESIEIIGECFLASSSSDHLLTLSSLDVYPPVASGSEIYNSTPNWYTHCSECMKSTGTKSVTLVSGANMDLEKAAQGTGLKTYSIGFSETSGQNAAMGFWYGHSFGQPILRVTYSGQPDSILTITAPSASVCTGNQYCITWNSDPSATSYDISVNNAPWMNNGFLTTQCYINSAAGNYTYSVRARNKCGTGPASEPVTVTITNVPASTQNVWTADSTPCANSAYRISWNSIPNANSYEIREDMGFWETVTGSLFKEYSHLTGGVHSYSVRGNNQCGLGAIKTLYNVTVLDGPASPKNLRASDIDPCPGVSVQFLWSPSTFATEYQLVDSSTGTVVYTGTDTSWINPAMATGSHNYWVKALNSCGASSETGPLTVATKSAPQPPRDLVSDKKNPIGTNTDYTLSWKSVAGATSYSLYKKIPRGTKDSLVYKGENLSITLNSSTPDTSTYYVIACDECTCSKRSPELTVVVDNPTDVVEDFDNDKSNPLDFALNQNYPNPFNPETRIEFSIGKAGFVKLIVYDILGRTVRTLVNERLSAGHKAIVWDGKDDFKTSVPSGVYFYKLETESFSESKKMVIVK